MAESATEIRNNLVTLLQKHPLVGDSKYAYGTAGFRYKANVMEGIVLRVGICCALLLQEQKDANMGIMLTASHNDESYNGVKVSNPDGSMIDVKQEEFLVEWVNQTDTNQWDTLLQQKCSGGGSTTGAGDATIFLHVGRDTRSDSPSLAQLMIQGASLTMSLLNLSSAPAKLQVSDHGILTTPMLHHIVLHSNHAQYLPKLLYPPLPSRDGYLDLLAQAYCDLINKVAREDMDKTASSSALQIDSACGVGFEAVQQVNAKIQALHSSPGNARKFQAWNGPSDGPLNMSCGSEHVQKQLKPPTWYGKSPPTTSYCCSLDGDADRIVFFSSDNDKLTLLDGDKIAVLLAHFFKQQNLPSSLKMGVVQTAYANGASTEYIQNTLQIPVIITKTGVKHLHHAATHNFDVGIYFEANGHGTVVFGPKFYETCSDASQYPVLTKVARLINPAVGDAVSDLLLVDAILQAESWTLQDWNALYQDLPSRQLKVAVKDRSVVKCNDNETKCIAPTTLQPALEELMKAGGPGFRTFVRASGTENVVRVYAEAPTRNQADTLASAAAKLVQEHCGGVEPKSSI